MNNILLIGNLSPANIAAFNDVESQFRIKGHYIINPVRSFTLHMNNDRYFTHRYLESITACTAVYFMPDHKDLANINVLISAVKALGLTEYNNCHNYIIDEVHEHINY